MHRLFHTRRTAALMARVTIAVAFGFAASVWHARTAHAAGEVAMKPNDARSGTLLFKPKGGGDSFEGLRQSTDVTIRVSGIVARTTVRQTFRNPHDEWFEGIYVFPLPENAAVDHLKMRIGERAIQGVIKEKAAAKALYEEAKAGGRRAALLEQERPNLFTSSVANIGPREEVTVELEYQQTLRYDNGRFSLRFPTAITPRYIPGAVKVAGLAGTGWAANTDAVVDAARITPLVPHPRRLAEPLNPIKINVVLDAGVPLAAVDSPYHRVRVKEIDAQRREIELEGESSATRDFELVWTPVASEQAHAAFFTEQKDGKTYGLLMVMPPNAAAVRALPREVIYVIDTSGSMEGASIVQAREALQMAVERLHPGDRFNVIEFNSTARALFADAQPASRQNVNSAVRWVQQLRARGGTEMALALNLALSGKESPERVRQVIFLTDGAVGNEEQLFKLIADNLGDSRLFTVGIGSAPNSHFMNKAAQAGRGTFTYIGKVEEVKEKMSALFAKLESPVLKGVRVAWPKSDTDAPVEAWPHRVPDLYLGEPIVVSAALSSAGGEVKLTGLNGDALWQATLPLASASPGTGMGVLWAREKIGALTDSLRDGQSEALVRPAVVEVALSHHLVSQYTSLVAVDRTPVRRPDDPLKSIALPVNLPDSAEHEAVFGTQPGELPRTATDARFNIMLGFLLLLVASLLWQYRRRIAV
ncbi:MAG: marine proteobacterial sortase target protein [Burkholderiales bacterium]